MSTQSAHPWSHLKPHLQRLDKDALVLLLRDLYALNADNKVFLSTRFLATSFGVVDRQLPPADPSLERRQLVECIAS